MNWFYALNGQQAGPVDDAELDRLVQAGTISNSTLVWYSGMAQWLPYTEARQTAPALAGVAGGGAPAVIGEGQAQCSQCGKVLPADEVVRVDNYNVCALCKPMLLQKLREGVSPAVGAFGLASMRYGGFWIRFGAVFLDGLILSPFIYGPLIYSAVMRGPQALQNQSLQPLLLGLQYGLPIAYETIMIGRYGATLGKMACRLQVVRANGEPITYARSLGRHFAKILSTIILFVGYIMAAFDDQKRALHDHICDTRVVVKPPPGAAAASSF